MSSYYGAQTVLISRRNGLIRDIGKIETHSIYEESFNSPYIGGAVRESLERSLSPEPPYLGSLSPEPPYLGWERFTVPRWSKPKRPTFSTFPATEQLQDRSRRLCARIVRPAATAPVFTRVRCGFTRTGETGMTRHSSFFVCFRWCHVLPAGDAES